MTRQTLESRSLIDSLDLIIYMKQRDLDTTITEIINKISQTDEIINTLNLEGFD